jgi:GABA(A) receptor-associated protein
MKFKLEHSFELRKTESERVRTKYPEIVPGLINIFDKLYTFFSFNNLLSNAVICEKIERSKMEEIDKKKYLVPSDLTCGQFVFVIRKRLRLVGEKAIFLFINGVIPQNTAVLSDIYDKFKDKDGFLYISYSDETVFG